MKRTSCIFLIVMILIFCLTGCVTDPPTYYFEANYIIENATKIELVECKNDKPKEVIVDDSTILNFDINDVVVIKELEKSKFEDFAMDLSSITFHIENKSVNSPLGYAVIIYLKNKEIIVLSCTIVNYIGYSMVATFTVDGEFISHIATFADEPKFKKLLERYFEI